MKEIVKQICEPDINVKIDLSNAKNANTNADIVILDRGVSV